jgi:phospholipid/cholesterol/gamma-HCH transport system substrate-binding protein
MTNKDTKKYKLKVGYTVFAGLIIFFFFIIMVGTEGYYFTPTYHLNLLVKSTDGLIEGGKVLLGGLKVGQIDKISFTTVNNENLVKIRLELLKKFSSQITVNSHARIETSGLLGDKLIEISLGNPTEKALTEGEYLPVKESFSFDNLSDKIEPLVDNINKITYNLRIITDTIKSGKGNAANFVFGSETSSKLNSLLNNLNNFTESINNKNSTLGKLVNNDDLYKHLTSISSDLKNIMDTVKSGKGTLGKFIKNDSLYANINKLSYNLNKTAESLRSDSTFVGGMINNKDGYKKLILLLDELNKLVTDIKNNPGRYINLSIF